MFKHNICSLAVWNQKIKKSGTFLWYPTQETEETEGKRTVFRINQTLDVMEQHIEFDRINYTPHILVSQLKHE